MSVVLGLNLPGLKGYVPLTSGQMVQQSCVSTGHPECFAPSPPFFQLQSFYVYSWDKVLLADAGRGLQVLLCAVQCGVDFLHSFPVHFHKRNIRTYTFVLVKILVWILATALFYLPKKGSWIILIPSRSQELISENGHLSREPYQTVHIPQLVVLVSKTG